MRVPLNWLKEFVEITVSPGDLAERLTAAGVAVDVVVPVGGEINGVVVGRVEEIRPHPNADRLTICRTGTSDAVYEVVTGAPNLFPGAVVPLALEGARLAGGKVLKKARFRGVSSCGMLCSEAELGLEEKSSGIMILPAETPLGEDIRKILGLPDHVLELDLTPNRGDCLSILGVAREVAALYGLELKLPPVLNGTAGEAGDYIKVEINAHELCGRYAARVFKDVRIGPSPVWMQTRLRLAGMRPINNIVDVTNYVMLELGQPLHAFDCNTLRGGKIVVRRAGDGEKLVSLDGVPREFGTDDLLIADAEGAVAIAGVMGGLDTEVTSSTGTILLESANFNPRSIRRTARELSLRSEASLRFEKGVDIQGAVQAADRTAYFVEKIGAGRVVPGVVDCYPVPPEPKTVIVRPALIDRILGVEVPRDQAVKWLERLGFRVSEEDKRWVVRVPTYRPDVGIEEDIVEEVARFYGYDRIPATLISGETTAGRRSPEDDFQGRTCRLLSGLGLTEIITYSFIDPAFFDRLRVPLEDPLRRVLPLKNPISEEQSVLRTTLLPGILGTVGRNVSRRVVDAAVFEVGKVFILRGSGELPEEPVKLGLAVTGKGPRGWGGAPEEMDFFFLKGIIEAAMKRLGITDVVFKAVESNPFLHPGRTATVLSGGKELGFIGQIHPEVQEALELPNRVVVGEFDFGALFAVQRAATFSDLPRFPGVPRDVAFILPEEVPAATVMDTVKTAAGTLLREIGLFDVYRGGNLPPGTRSLAFSLLFQSEDRTLTDDEVTGRIDAVVSRLKEQFGGVLRG
ncbi:MAG: phenylalanine--tRNA ligase subunit beta [Bacillota bacterium]